MIDIHQELTIDDFAKWLANLCKHKTLYQNIFVETFLNTEDEKELTVNIYTEKHMYNICAIGVCNKNKVSYLGCILHNRAPNPGEKYIHQQDLADGLLCLNTWYNILKDIVFHEMDKINEQPHYLENEDEAMTFENVLKTLQIND